MFQGKVTDFNYVGMGGVTIFRSSFVRYLNARVILNKRHEELSKMVAEIESVFFWLIEEAEKHHTKEEIKSILEKTDNAGDAVIIIASDMSELILEKLLELNVRPNNITHLFVTPEFKFKKLAKSVKTLFKKGK